MGTLTRYPGIIPSTSPDPVKMSVGASSSNRIAASPALGMDETRESGGDGYDGHANLQDDDDIGIPDDDWIIDDLGDGMEDKPAVNGHGAREMGNPVEIYPSSNCVDNFLTQSTLQRRSLPFNLGPHLSLISDDILV